MLRVDEDVLDGRADPRRYRPPRIRPPDRGRRGSAFSPTSLTAVPSNRPTRVTRFLWRTDWSTASESVVCDADDLTSGLA